MTIVYYIIDLLLVVDHVVDARVSERWGAYGRCTPGPDLSGQIGTMCLDLWRTPRPTKGWSGSVKLRY